MPPASKAKEANNDKYMYVRSTTGDNRVAFHEVDDAHPGGSVIVAGPGVVKVGRTPFALARVRERALAEVKDSGERSKADKAAKAREDALPDVGRPVVPSDEDVDEDTGEITNPEADEDANTKLPA